MSTNTFLVGMRQVLILILLICLNNVSADPYKGFGVSQGDTFDYTFNFNHKHVGEEIIVFDVYDLQELDERMNDSIQLSNDSIFQVEIGDYSGSRFTKPDRIPSFIHRGNYTIALNDVPEMLIHDTNWDTYRERLERRLSWTPPEEEFVILESDAEIGYYLEWLSDMPDINNTFTIRYDKSTGMTLYYHLNTIDDHTNELSFTTVEFILIDDNKPPEFKISLSEWYVISLGCLVIGRKLRFSWFNIEIKIVE